MRHSIGFWAFAFATLAIAVRAESFIVPVNGTLYMSAAGGSAGMFTHSALVCHKSSYTPYFAGLHITTERRSASWNPWRLAKQWFSECPPYGTAKPIGLSQTAPIESLDRGV